MPCIAMPMQVQKHMLAQCNAIQMQCKCNANAYAIEMQCVCYVKLAQHEHMPTADVVSTTPLLQKQLYGSAYGIHSADPS